MAERCQWSSDYVPLGDSYLGGEHFLYEMVSHQTLGAVLGREPSLLYQGAEFLNTVVRCGVRSEASDLLERTSPDSGCCLKEFIAVFAQKASNLHRGAAETVSCHCELDFIHDDVGRLQPPNEIVEVG